MSAHDPNRRLRALIVTGNDHFHHRWRAASARFREILEERPYFDVRVTEAFEGATAATLASFDVVLLNYFGADAPAGQERRWGEETERALFDYVRNGGGLVVLHGSFWMGATWDSHAEELLELFGGAMRSTSRRAPGEAVEIHLTQPDHPITRGLTVDFVSPVDDKYVNIAVPPDNDITVLADIADPAEAYLDGAYYAMNAMPGPKIYDIESARALPGADQRHPVSWTKAYGDGRVFALAFGHVGASTIGAAHRGRAEGRDIGPTMDIATRLPQYKTMLVRGTEWAATGQVREDPPDEVPEHD